MTDEWDIDEFEDITAHHYCKNNKEDERMVETDFITGEITNGKGFRYEMFDKDMNPVILICNVEIDPTPKAARSGVKAQMKVMMRKDRNE
tara:strand:+ start:302 stop:571 length:270 start_codon:yes stop_codon:yes gene_type:complete